MARNSGVSFGTLLGLLFIGLKLGKVIDWSWLWVLCPLWIPLVIYLTALILCGVGVLVIKILQFIFRG